VSKLCATDKKKKVQFSIREITQGSKKKTYGPYLGEIEKLAKPIELKGRVIKYKPVAKLAGKKTKTGGAKKKGSVLVVEAKDGKITKKYITKKQADKHMKPRHKRLDKGMKAMHKGMKKLHKSMSGGAKAIYRVTRVTPEELRNFCDYIYKNLDKSNYTLAFIGPENSPHSFVIIINNEETITKFIGYTYRSDFKGKVDHYTYRDYKKYFPNEQLFPNEELRNS
jgi:hypothetical protein